MSIEMKSTIEKHVDMQYISMLEIGAYSSQTYRKEDANIKFLDVQSKEILLKDTIFHNKSTDIVDVDFLVKINKYESYIDETFDVIIADNVFEHISNPIRWLITQASLLNNKEFLFIRCPEYTLVFDKFRNPTDFSHIITDYIKDVPDLDPEHCIESSIFYTLTSVEDRPIDERISIDNIRHWYENPHFGIHCHCFEYATFINRIIKPILLTGLVDLALVEHNQDTPSSFFTVFKKGKSERVALTSEEFVGQR
jgi:hypothetical protein